jgi:hypothetical protein
LAAQQAQEKPVPSGGERPKIRAVTAFVRLDRARYRAEIKEALAMLTKAKSTFEGAGYEVEAIRITTQPFPEYIKDLPREDALAFFREYDALAHKEGFDAAIGPAMLADSDDPRQAELLGEILVGTSMLEGSIVVAGEDGIHWNAVRAAAKTIKYVSLRSPHSGAGLDQRFQSSAGRSSTAQSSAARSSATSPRRRPGRARSRY